MRIARVTLSFFSVGFLAGTFEQAAGVGAVQHAQRTPALVAATVASAPASSAARATEPAASPAASGPPRGEPLSLVPPEPERLALALGAPAGIALPLEAGDASVAEAVAAAFLAGPRAPGTNQETAQGPGVLTAASLAPALGSQRPMSQAPHVPPLPLARRAFVSLPALEEAMSAPQAGLQAEGVSPGAPAAGAQEFIMPIAKGRVTSTFNQGRYHPAIDLAAPLGTPVQATTRKQKVTFAGQRGGYGNLVITRDPSGREHYYGHLQRIVAGIGALLEQGDLLGLLGSTGHSTGPHVHYEVRTRAGGHMNPATLLFPDRRVSAGYAWNNSFGAGGRVAVAGAPPAAEPALRSSARRVVRTAHRASRRHAGARYRTTRYVVTRTPRRAAVRYAGRYGQPRPR